MDMEKARNSGLLVVAVLIILALLYGAVRMAIPFQGNEVPIASHDSAVVIIVEEGWKEGAEAVIIVTTALPGEGWLAVTRRICGFNSMELARRNSELNSYCFGFVPLGKELKVLCN